MNENPPCRIGLRQGVIFLKTEYSIQFAGETIGCADVERQGLYYRISCRCRLSGEVPVRIHLMHRHGETDLGLCVPMESGFGIDTRIPVKRAGEEITGFYAVASAGSSAAFFVPVSPDEPFQYISRLKDCFLSRRGDRIGVVLPDQREISKPTGQ